MTPRSSMLAVTVAVLCLALPGAAQALEMEYHLVGTGNLVIPALQRLALVFSDYGLETAFISITAIGILYGAGGAAIQGLAGGRASIYGWMIPILFGGTLFGGAILPQGTLHVYDETTNRYQAVGGIPDLIVFLAGSLNIVERMVVEAVDTGTADAESYRLNGGGLSFALLREAHRYALASDDIAIDNSLYQYWEDCLGVALNSSAYPVTNQVIYRDTVDPVNEVLANLTSGSISTITYLDTSDKAGETVYCTDAWARLGPRLTNPATFEGQTRALCGRAGFNPVDAGQLARCKETLAFAYEQVAGASAGGDWATLIRSLYSMQMLQKVMAAGNQDLALKMIANQQILSQAIGQSQTAGDWMNQMRGLVTALSLGAVPFLLLFIATPIGKKALLVVFGLLFFVTTWGVMDAVAHRGAMDAAYFAMMEIQRSKLGIESLWLFPHDTIKAAVVFGEARTRAVMMAGFITTSIVGVSAYAMTQMAGRVQATIDQAGSRAGADVYTPEGRIGLERRMQDTVGAETRLGGGQSIDFGTTMAYSAQTGHAKNMQELAHGASRGFSATQTASLAGTVAANTVTGPMAAAQHLTRALGGNPASQEEVANTLQSTAKFESAMRMFNTTGATRALFEMTPQGGDPMQTLMAISTAQGMEKMGQGSGYDDLLRSVHGHMRENHARLAPSGTPAPTMRDAMMAIGQAQYAQLDGSLQAVAGDADKLVDLAAFSSGKSLHQMTGFLRELGTQGVTLERAMEAEGAMQAFQRTGDVAALDNYSREEIAAGAKLRAFQVGASGAEGVRLDQQGTDFREVADTLSAKEYGAVAAFVNAARSTNIGASSVDVARDQAGLAGVRMQMDADAMRDFGRQYYRMGDGQDVFSRDQKDAIARAFAERGEGTTGTLTLRVGEQGLVGADFALGGQVIAQSSARSDASQVEDRSQRVDESRTTDATTNLRTGTREQHGHRIEGAAGVGTFDLAAVDSALVAANDGDYRAWGAIAAQADGNEATRQQLLDTLANQVVGRYGRVTASDADTSDLSADVGGRLSGGVRGEMSRGLGGRGPQVLMPGDATADIGDPTAPPALPSPVSGRVAASAAATVDGGLEKRWGNNDKDATEWQLTRAHLEDRWNQAHQRAESEANVIAGDDMAVQQREYQDRLGQYTAQAVLATRDKLREEATEQAQEARSGLPLIGDGKRLPD